MMKKTMKRAMVAMMAVLALTGAAASTTTVFAHSADSIEEQQPNKIIAIVRVSKGYLALRTAPCYDERNEIGELYTGDDVEVLRRTDNGYVYVYCYKYGTYGYVNANYLF